MSAAEKLKALDEAMTPGRWGEWDEHDNAIPTSHWDYYLRGDADGVASLRNALPQIRAVVETLESMNDIPMGMAKSAQVVAALAALEEALS